MGVEGRNLMDGMSSVEWNGTVERWNGIHDTDSTGASRVNRHHQDVYNEGTRKTAGGGYGRRVHTARVEQVAGQGATAAL